MYSRWWELCVHDDVVNTFYWNLFRCNGCEVAPEQSSSDLNNYPKQNINNKLFQKQSFSITDEQAN